MEQHSSHNTLTDMLKPLQKVAIYMEGHLNSDYAKMGIGVMRYITNPIVCVIDSTFAGKRVKDASSLPYDFPIVATVRDASELGADVLVLGLAPSGGRVPDDWLSPLGQAIDCGLSIVNGLHDSLNSLLGHKIPDSSSQWIWDVRHPAFTPEIAMARAAELKNKRVLMVGTDMAIGKMTAGLEIYRWLKEQKKSAAFVATGQIGITISGGGIPLDAFKVDHACGAVESAVMDVAEHEFIIVEGQGSILHPGSSATLSLMRGSCANYLILCHRAGMEHLRNPHIKLPALKDFIELNEALAGACGSLTAAKTVGIALNTSRLDEADAHAEINRLEEELGLPVDDLVRFGSEKIGQALARL